MIKKPCLLFVYFFFIIFTFNDLCALTLAEDKVEFSAGFQNERIDGYDNSGATFIKVKIKNPPFSGRCRVEVVLQSGYSDYSIFSFRNTYRDFDSAKLVKYIEVKKDGISEVFIPFYPDERINEFKLIIYNENENIFTKIYQTNYDAGRLVGVLSDDEQFLRFLQSYGNKISAAENKTSFIFNEMDSTQFYNPYFHSSSLEVIIVNDIEFNKFDSRAINGFYTYLNRGGILIFTPETLLKNRENIIFKQLFGDYECIKQPQNNNDTAFSNFFKLEKTIDIERYSFKPSITSGLTYWTDSSKNAVILKRESGCGYIYITLFLMGYDKIMKTSVNAKKSKTGDNLQVNEYGKIYQDIINRARGKCRNSFGFYVPEEYLVSSKNKICLYLLIFYLIVVGPVQFFVLKKNNKLEYLWKSTGLISIFVTILFSIILFTTLKTEKKMEQYDLLNFDSKNIANKTSYLLVYTTDQDTHNLYFKNNFPINEPSLKYSYNDDKKQTDKQTPSFNYFDTYAEVQNIYLKNNSGKVFTQAETFKTENRMLDCVFVLNSRGINGRVKNISSKPLKNAAVFFYDNQRYIGDLKPNDEVKIYLPVDSGCKEKVFCSDRNFCDERAANDFFTKYPEVKKNHNLFTSLFPAGQQMKVVVCANSTSDFSRILINKPDFKYSQKFVISEYFDCSYDTMIYFFPSMIMVDYNYDNQKQYNLIVTPPLIFTPKKLVIYVKTPKHIINNEYEKVRLQIYDEKNNVYSTAGEQQIAENITFILENSEEYYLYSSNSFRIELSAIKAENIDNPFFGYDAVNAYLEGEIK